MTDPLPVHISHEKLHSLEVPPSYETTGSFDIRLINHAESLHVHLHLNDPLSEVARLEAGAGNHYIEGETERRVRVEVDPDRIDGESHLGKLKVATAYGGETRWIDIKVTKPDPESETVDVDESLATPQPRTTDSDGLRLPPAAPILALGGIAILIAGSIAYLFQETIIVLGAFVVLAGVVGAFVFLLRNDSPV